MTIAETLESAGHRLAAAGVTEPRREAASLLAFALRKDRIFLIAHPERQLTENEVIAFDKYLSRREDREPFQYITGRQEFFGSDFLVTPDVLIPRPETEILVEAAINRMPKEKPVSICEVGIGSGCISISLLDAMPNATAVGLEISEAAIGVARINAERIGVSDRFEIHHSDLFAALSDEKFDMIVSNPPYVSVDEYEVLQAEVGRYEPKNALTDGSDGLSIVRRIILSSPEYLHPGGWLLMEIGLGQAPQVEQMFDRNLWPVLELLNDLQGIPRTIVARQSDA